MRGASWGDEHRLNDGTTTEAGFLPVPSSRHRNIDERREYSSSDQDDLQSDLHRINKKKEKKLQKELTLAVNGPFPLGLKHLTTDDIMRARVNENMILLRAIKQNTTLQQILKNDKLISWDHPLLLAAIKALYKHQIKILSNKGKHNLAARLSQDMKDLLAVLTEDILCLTPEAVYATFTALFTGDTYYTDIYESYMAQRSGTLQEIANRSSALPWNFKYCIGYNFKIGGCERSSCNYLHKCPFHSQPVPKHKAMECDDNPNKWKESDYKNGFDLI